jgi:ABC-type transport system involved in multi-copper enzyme maturation permease subunit
VTVQFLAFLKDSYREARSGWMLQIMLVMGALLVLLVSSVGFRSTTIQDELADELNLFTKVFATNPETGKPQLSVENVTCTNEAEPWKADYTFEYVVKCETREDMRRALRARGLPVSRSAVEAHLKVKLGFLNDLRVTGGPPEMEKPLTGDDDEPAEAKDGKEVKKRAPLPREVRYQVSSKGTAAEDQLAWRHRVSIFFGYEPPLLFMSLREGVYVLQKYLVNYVAAWVLLAVAVVVTSGFVPNMLAKGSLDLLASKPIGRTRLLLYKYVGGLTFVFVLTTLTVLGVWVAIGARTGLWSPNFLAVIPVLTFCFAALYAFSVLASVLTRNTLATIMLTGLAWALLWCVGKVNDGIENRAAQLAKLDDLPEQVRGVARERMEEQPVFGFIPKSTFPVFKALHTVAPRTYDVDERLSRVIAAGLLTPNQMKARDYGDDPRYSWGEMLGATAAGIAVVLALACWRFSSRDY